MTNKHKTVLYIGVTNNLLRRVYEHFIQITNAIEREKQIKKWRREKKDNLINSFNPKWRFLNDDIFPE